MTERESYYLEEYRTNLTGLAFQKIVRIFTFIPTECKDSSTTHQIPHILKQSSHLTTIFPKCNFFVALNYTPNNMH